jgi:hypothetical protein
VLVLMLQHLARWSVGRVPNLTPAVQIRAREDQLDLLLAAAEGTGELRWAPGRRVLPMTDDALQVAARAMHLRLRLMPETGEAQISFPVIGTHAP